MKTHFSIVALAMVCACGQASISKRPALLVLVNNTQQETGKSIAFPQSTGGTKGGILKVTVANAGDKSLSISSIRLEGADGAASGNAYISIDPPFSSASFPHVIKANDLGATQIQFNLVYSPGGTYDDRPSVLVIQSNDPKITGGTYRLTVYPVQKKAQIVVEPPNATFLNATASMPGFQDFVIKNVGSETMELQGITFALATSEFTIMDPPNKGTLIDPEGSGMGNPPVKFRVRYAPTDTPDQNRVLIAWRTKGEDALEEFGVDLYGEVQKGMLQCSYADQVAGYLDFSAQSDVGATCSKVINCKNVGQGPVNIKRPVLQQAALPDGSFAYSVDWFLGGGEQQDPPCGAYAGTAVTSETLQLANQKSVAILVTYKAPGAKGINGKLLINYTDPYPGSKEFTMIGGAAKGELCLAPFGQQLVFFAEKDKKATKTAVIGNCGNGPLTIKAASADEAYPGVDPDAFQVTSPKPLPVEIEPWGLLALTVEFTGFEQPKVNGSLNVTYVGPTTGNDETASFNLLGSSDLDGVTLPTADPGKPSDYSGAKAGNSVTLDGSQSTGGSNKIYDNGYIWFLSGKPSGSKIFPAPAAGGPKYGVVPDVAGDYEFRLVVFSVSEDQKSYFSDEGVVTISVQP